LIKSPCTGHCGINKDHFCGGCGRTRGEIQNWRSMSEEEKKEASVRAASRKGRSDMHMRDSCGDND